MATQTTYYEFNKPAGSDLVNPLVDNNPNWDKADAALHGLSINSIGTAVEVITLGVHALTRINQPDAKFFTFIATGDFDAGETFTLDGVAITAALPDGSSLGSDCYVTGACVLVGLNADNTLATFYLPSTGATAPDSLRLGGELPSYYATAAALANAVQSITDLNNLMGNTSISSIGDGTATGAISAINADLVDGIGGTDENFRFGTDGSGNYGYIKKVEGADTFFPFSNSKLPTNYTMLIQRRGTVTIDASLYSSFLVFQAQGEGNSNTPRHITYKGMHIYSHDDFIGKTIPVNYGTYQFTITSTDTKITLTGGTGENEPVIVGMS